MKPKHGLKEATATPLDAVIIGAGFAGVGMGVAMKKAGFERFLLLERGSGFGGVWRDNTYPGAACDVPSHLYSFSFAPHPGWTHVFSRQAEILKYIEGCAVKYGLAAHTRFDSEVAAASWDDGTGLWRVRLQGGDTISARTVICATGQLSRPAIPRIEGEATFQGRRFHSAQWDHSFDLSGKRIAVIGTGASAVQFIPEVAQKAAHLTVFQRSPVYVLPRPDRRYRADEQRRFCKQPLARRAHRARIFLEYDARALGFGRSRRMMAPAVALARATLRAQVKDPALQKALTPTYEIGCKRILLSNDYLPTFNRANVALVTHGIEKVEPAGLRTRDGVLHRVDAIIYGTGFQSTAFLAPMKVTGSAGVDLQEAWRDGAQAYLGVSVPHFPNFFILYGPNTNLGHNSIILMLEGQIAHVTRALRALRRAPDRVIEVQDRAHKRFVQRVRKKLDRSVWATCRSYYLDAEGRNTTNWPGFSWTYRVLLLMRGLSAYRLNPIRT